jgi:hypothetical protein
MANIFSLQFGEVFNMQPLPQKITVKFGELGSDGSSTTISVAGIMGLSYHQDGTGCRLQDPGGNAADDETGEVAQAPRTDYNEVTFFYLRDLGDHLAGRLFHETILHCDIGILQTLQKGSDQRFTLSNYLGDLVVPVWFSQIDWKFGMAMYQDHLGIEGFGEFNGFFHHCIGMFRSINGQKNSFFVHTLPPSYWKTEKSICYLAV